MIIPFPDLHLSLREIYEAMGYGETQPDIRVIELVEDMLLRVKRTVVPRAYYQISDCEILSEQIKIQDTLFNTGKIIARSLRHSGQMVLFVATAGLEYEALVREVKTEDDCALLFILDSIGTCIAESAGDYLEKRLQDEIGNLKHTNRFSPGYCGWDVTEQHKLFALLPVDVCQVKLSNSSLMYPIKSISGCIGIGEKVITHIYSCNICEMANCFRKRRKKQS